VVGGRLRGGRAGHQAARRTPRAAAGVLAGVRPPAGAGRPRRRRRAVPALVPLGPTPVHALHGRLLPRPPGPPPPPPRLPPGAARPRPPPGARARRGGGRGGAGPPPRGRRRPAARRGADPPQLGPAKQAELPEPVPPRPPAPPARPPPAPPPPAHPAGPPTRD